MKITNNFFRPFLAKYLPFGWQTGLLLIISFSATRFALVLHANATKSYQVVALIFVLMILMPFLLLTKEGRKAIGMKLPDHWIWLIAGAILGALSCAMMFFLAKLCFGFGEGNWFVYIAGTYSNVPGTLDENTRLVFFLIYSGPSMLFSPLGEEVFYRGIIHECFANNFGDRIASIIDSSAFSLVHLSHFGIIYSLQGWRFLPFPSLLWVLSLFGTCLLFYLSRVRSGSILGAIISHAVFNLTMNYFIFYYIL